MWKIKSVVSISKNFPANFIGNFQTKPFSCLFFLFAFELILDLYSFLPIHVHKYDYLFWKILIKNFKKIPKNKEGWFVWVWEDVSGLRWVKQWKRNFRIKLWLFFTAFGLLCKVFQRVFRFFYDVYMFVSVIITICDPFWQFPNFPSISFTSYWIYFIIVELYRKVYICCSTPLPLLAFLVVTVVVVVIVSSNENLNKKWKIKNERKEKERK